MDWRQSQGLVPLLGKQFFDFQMADNNSFFNLGSLTLVQLKQLKRFNELDKQGTHSDSRICTICDPAVPFDNAHGCRQHQIKTHFFLLRGYKKAYGAYFEAALKHF
jgi:hypothetical protein